MKTFLIIMLPLILLGIIACNKSSESNGTLLDCDTRPEWSNFDPECGCFGPNIGFSGHCMEAKGNEITYFARTNFHHIQDSLCLMYKPTDDKISLKNASNIGYGSISLGTTLAEAKAKNKNMLYEFFYQDVKDPSDALKQSKSYINVDPKKFDTSLEILKLMAYQKQIGLFGNAILDSTEIVFVKQLNRK